MSKTGLLISSRQFECGIERVAWHDRLPNLVDYDFVILDEPSLNEFCINRASTSDDRWVFSKPQGIDKDLHRNLGLIKRKLLEILPSQTAVFFVHQPSITVYTRAKTTSPFHGEYEHGSSSISTHDWCPLRLLVHEESGKRIQINDASYAGYLDLLDGWSFYFLTDRMDVSDLRDHYSDLGQDLSVTLSPIATSKASQILAFSIRFGFAEVSKGGTRRTTTNITAGAEFVLLPPISNIESSVQAIRQIVDPNPVALEPTWTADVRVPGEEELLVKASQLRQEAEEVETSLSEKRKLKKLLYEDGRTLQDLCGEAFRLLGATIRPSIVSDEFIIEVDGKQALVEVKGHLKSASMRDLSQLIKDLGNHLAKTEQGIHGILVGNAWRLDRLSQRNTKDKPVFPDNVVETAMNHGIGLLSTVELFGACCRVIEVPSEHKRILRSLMNGKGIVSLG